MNKPFGTLAKIASLTVLILLCMSAGLLSTSEVQASADNQPALSGAANTNAIGTALTLSSSSSDNGQTVTIKATIVPIPDGGTVQFQDNGINLGSPVPVNPSGRADYSSSSLTPGKHSIVAVYSGNANYMASATIAEITIVETTTLILDSSANTSAKGQPITFTASINPVPDGGTVQFQDNGVNIGNPVSLNASGQATYILLSPDIGTHSITAKYSGSANFTSSMRTVEKVVKTRFAGSIPLPEEVSTDLAVAGANALLSLALVIILFIAGTLFNSTFKNNYEALESWFGRVRRRFSGSRFTKGIRSPFLEFLLIILVSAAINSFVDPSMGFSREGLILFIAMLVGVTLLTYGYDGVQALTMSKGFHIPARVKSFPLAIPIAIVFVLVSRLVGFNAGLLFGFVGAFAIVSSIHKPDLRQSSSAILAASAVVLVFSLLAFFLRQPLASLAPTFWVQMADTTLVAIFVLCLEGVVFGLIPLTVLDGGTLYSWKKWVWAVLFFIAVFEFWYIIINPGNILTEAVSGAKFVTMVSTIGLFVLFALAFWVYFQFKKRARKVNS